MNSLRAAISASACPSDHRGREQGAALLSGAVCAARLGAIAGQIIYRANILLAESSAETQEALQLRQQHAEIPFPMRPGVRDALMKLDSRNLAGVPRPAFQSGALPTTFVGSPDTVVKQVERCREEVGAGVIDLFFQSSAADDPKRIMQALELFGKAVRVSPA